MTIDEHARPLAHVVRGDLVESVHLGHLVLLDADGAVRGRRGDPDAVTFPRSALKPVQAVAMLRAGLDLHGELLALAAASHSGEPAHLAGVRRILAGAGLDESALDNTPDVPLGERAGAGTEAGAAAFAPPGTRRRRSRRTARASMPRCWPPASRPGGRPRTTATRRTRCRRRSAPRSPS